MKWNVKIISACSLLLLTSCTFNPFSNNNHLTGSPAGAAVGAGIGAGATALLNAPKSIIALTGLGGGALGYYMTTQRFDAGGIIQAGGQVYKVGDYVGIYIPSDKIFEPNTADFLPQSGPILDSAVAVLERHPNNNIIVSGNTAGFDRMKRENRLSRERAKQVAAYLWSQGINNFKDPGIHTRKLNYVGYGDFFPIATKLTNDGLRTNSRIQIVSYPSDADLGLDSHHLTMANIGSMEDCPE